jgi:Gram-negative bacterial TonB protein C-terminal
VEKAMKRLWILVLILASGSALACAKPAKDSAAEDVVFNNISPQTMELDQELQGKYGCKYAFAMLFSSEGYTPMKLVSGSQPPTPADAAGEPITGAVLVGFVLNTDGVPVDPVVLKSTDDRLAKIALEHVGGLRYSPSQFKARPVRSLGIQVYQFK